MARKKPARPAKKAKKQAKKRTASKAASRKGRKKSPKKATAGRRAARIKAVATKRAKATVKKATRSAAAIKAAGTKKAAAVKKKPNLDRPRKTVADIHGIPSSLDANRGPSAAKSGRAEMKDRIAKTGGAGPALTGGDIDADWESAESIGDEAPGGDNPTPDQDVVDDIGRALGVEYDDDEELQGGAEIVDRDKHRWELDPASKDDDEDTE